MQTRARCRGPCLRDLDPSLGTPAFVSRQRKRSLRNVSDGFPCVAATPRTGLAHPIHHPRETIRSTRQRRLGSRMARPPAPCCVLQRHEEYDPRYVRPMTATNTVNNLHPRFARLPRASDDSISRCVRTLGAWRVSRRSTRFGDSTRLPRGVFFRERDDFLIPRTISTFAFVRSSLNRVHL